MRAPASTFHSDVMRLEERYGIVEGMKGIEMLDDARNLRRRPLGVASALLRARGAPLASQSVQLSTARAMLSEHRTMAMQPSRWQWHKFKDMLHYYAMVGLIPVTAIITYCNVFIGPAQLTPTPEGYHPKHWEYHRHPITRFIARYIHDNPQQNYEKFMHFIDEEAQRVKLRRLEAEIKRKMEERQDYQAYYYRPLVNTYLRNEKIISDDTYNRLGEHIDE